jgi:heat-inducible transcriptional repressor
MLSMQPVKKPMAQEIQEELAGQAGSQQVVQKASSLLSDMTQMAGVVMVPKQESASLRQIEFLPLEGNQVLAILVVNNQEVQNRIISTERRYSRAELEQAASYLTTHFSGRHIKDMCRSIHEELLNTQSEVNQLMELVVKVTGQIEEVDTGSDDLLVQGQSNLIGGSGMEDMGQLRRLFDAFSEKRDIAHLLDSCTNGDGVQIYIGHESGYEPLGDCSVVTAPYSVEGETMGVLGVIGPTRMDYERVVPVVDLTAKLLSSALSHEG